MNEEEYWYWICNINGIMRGKIGLLLDNFNYPWEVYQAGRKSLERLKGLSAADIDAIVDSRKPERIKEDLEYMYNEGIRFLYPSHQDYPVHLKLIKNYPYSLYVKGHLPDEDKPAIAMIGARAAGSYGRGIAKKISGDLAEAGFQIISGLARGIDSIAMEAAIDAGGRSYGVLGCGIDVVYPPENRRLFEKTLSSGGIITEYPLHTKPLAMYFPLRNRIISGLSDAVAVIEARDKSGSLITVDYALEQGKEIFAVPGRADDLSTTACNRLIKDGAYMLTEAKDVLEAFGIFKDDEVKLKGSGVDESLGRKYGELFNALTYNPKTISQLMEETGLGREVIIKGLGRMEVDGLISQVVPGYYSKV